MAILFPVALQWSERGLPPPPHVQWVRRLLEAELAIFKDLGGNGEVTVEMTAGFTTWICVTKELNK